MNKKLMAVAVGAALAPGLALAQSSVTISGIFKVGLDNIRLSGGSPAVVAARAGMNNSETRVSDNSSRIIFNVTEDLGGGMQAIAQLDLRFSPDQVSPLSVGSSASAYGANQAGNPIGSGNTWVGLRGKSWGTLTLGRHDLHYGKQPDDIAAKAGALMASSVSLMDYMQAPAIPSTASGLTAATTAGNSAIAGATRTPNVIRWDTPQWGIFSGTLAYSTNPAVEGDLVGGGATGNSTAATGGRKGGAWNINPQLTGANWQLGYSYWKAKPDAPVFTNAPAGITNTVSGTSALLPGGASGTAANATISADQRGDVIYGFYRWGGFKIGGAWNKSKLSVSTGALSGQNLATRTAWTIPASYTWGNHNVYGHYTRARDVSSGIAGATTTGTGARMWAFAYVYDLSKRTSAGITYARINNDTNAGYTFFTNGCNGFGSAGTSCSSSAAVGYGSGVDQRLLQATIRHAF